MKNSSVLIKRAALFTGIVIAVTMAVSLSAFAVITRIQTNAAARAQLIPMTGFLAELASEDPANAPDRLADGAGLVASYGGQLWLVQVGDGIVRKIVIE